VRVCDFVAPKRNLIEGGPKQFRKQVGDTLATTK